MSTDRKVPMDSSASSPSRSPAPLRPQLVTDSTPRSIDWRDDLVCSGNPPHPLANLANCMLALRRAPEWQDVVALNSFSQDIYMREPAPWCIAAKHKPRTWTKNDDIMAAVWFQQQGINVKTAIASEAVYAAARENEYDPLVEYLCSLEWDGTPRVDTWLTAYLGADDTPLQRDFARCWLISAVARAFEPGCKADCCLVLESKQGRGKSSALRALCPDQDWFTDHIPKDLASKDSQILVGGVWLVEFAELQGIADSPKKVDDVKNFLSRQDDRYRPVHEKYPVRVLRRCIFAGSTNREIYLTDDSGGRRWWMVKCNWIYPDRIARDRDQLWAEAVALYSAGTKWHLNSESEVEARELQKERLVSDVWQDTIEEWLDSRDSTSVREVLTQCLGKDLDMCDRSHEMRVSRCLTCLGWEKYRGPKGHNRYRRPEHWSL